VSAIPELRRNIYYYQCVTTGLAGILSGDVLRDIIGGQLDKYYDIGNRSFLSEGQKYLIQYYKGVRAMKSKSSD